MSLSYTGVEVLTTIALRRDMHVHDNQTPGAPEHVLASDPYSVGTGQWLLVGTDGWRDVVGARHAWRVDLTPSTGPGGGLA